LKPFPSDAQLTTPDVHMNFPGLDVSSRRPLHAQPERRVTNAVSEEGAAMHSINIKIKVC
jgi:hypothetical protein